MNIELIYCVECGFFPMANSLAASIKHELGIDVNLLEGHNGVYEMTVNGNVIFAGLGEAKELTEDDQIFREIQKYTDSSEFIKKEIEIFDPAMCCSTGVCGPSIDPELLRMATVINALKEKGIIVKRHGLSSEPQDFTSNKVISDLLQKEGADILPVTLVDGEVAVTKGYPTNEQLSTWLGTRINTDKPANQGDCCYGTKGCC